MAYKKQADPEETGPEEKKEPKTVEDQEVVSEVLDDFKRAWNAKQPKEQLFRELYRRYRGYLDSTQVVGRSMIFIPEAFTLIETVAPRMTAKKPAPKVLPRNTSTTSEADTAGQMLDYQYDVMGLQRKIKIFDKQRLVYGTTFMKMGWDADAKLPTADPVDIADIFPDPESTDYQGGFIIHRYYTELEELKESKVKYQNLDMLEMKEQATKRDDQMRQDRDAIQGIPYEPNRGGIECLEHWCMEDGDIMVKTIANRSVCIRNEKSKLPIKEIPIVEAFDQEVMFEKWGIGEIEPILDLQDEENTKRNQRIDEVNLSIHNMWVVSKMAGIDYQTIVSKPGGMILANDINGIKALEKQNVTQDSIQEINMIKEDIRGATGVNDYVRGNETGSDTASEVNTKTQEANVRFSEKVNNLEIALKRIFRWMHALTAAFGDDQMVIRVTGKYGVEMKQINRKDIDKEFDFDIEVGSSLPSNPELRRQQLRELTQVLLPVLQNPQGVPDGIRELLRTLIQSYDLKNTDEILQGNQHPAVNQTMAHLSPDELQGANPQLVENEIKRHLMAAGALNGQGGLTPPPQDQMAPQGAPAAPQGAPTPPQPGMQSGTQMPAVNTIR